MTKMNSFRKQFEAKLKGDNDGVKSAKAWRSAESALKVQIAALEGDTISLEDDVENAKEALKDARINNGEIIERREEYIDNLIEAKEDLTLAIEALDNHNYTLDFLKSEYAALKEDVVE